MCLIFSSDTMDAQHLYRAKLRRISLKCLYQAGVDVLDGGVLLFVVLR